MYYIGVDLGTSSVKLILMEPTGDIVNTVSKTYPISFPKPGWSEQNPTDWYDKTCEGIKEQLRNVIILIMRLERISLQNIQRI